MQTVLITGVNGFVGSHLAKELAVNGYKVIGVGGVNGSKNTHDHLDKYYELDLTKPEQISKIDFSNVHSIIHLAGLAAVGPSFNNPMQYIDVNIGIEVNLFETILNQGAKPNFLIVSSSTIYDNNDRLPLKETSKVYPRSPYSVSKIGQEQLAIYYQQRGFNCIIARPFNHFGPGQGTGFIVPDLVKQIINAERNNEKVIKVGNLESKRDYTDVRDIVKAYRLLLANGKSSEIYNICSGKSISGKDILNNLLRQANIKLKVVQDKNKLRPTDVLDIYGSNKKIFKVTGWKPEITIDKTLKDVIKDWRSK